jgi:hypothetical protein
VIRNCVALQCAANNVAIRLITLPALREARKNGQPDADGPQHSNIMGFFARPR